METNALEIAIDKAQALPKEAQEQIGRDMLLRIEKLEQLRVDLQVGIDELDTGEGEEIEIDDIIGEARSRHGEAP